MMPYTVQQRDMCCAIQYRKEIYNALRFIADRCEALNCIAAIYLICYTVLQRDM